MPDEAARRAEAYADAGADGIFVPGLTDLALIGKFVQLTPLPVNIMVTQGGWDIDRARPAEVKGFRFCSFDCGTGSQFHHGVRFSMPPYNAGRSDFPSAG